MVDLGDPWVKECSLYIIYNPDRKIVKCKVCERGCVLRPGLESFCGNYVNIDGRLFNVGYGLLSAVEIRPIEIKPFFHYYPNSLALTFSGWGCNFKCPWCQNYFLSWREPSPSNSLIIKPDELVNEAIKLGVHGLCASFNEPVIHYDYLIDLGYEAMDKGLYLTMVTNGYMTIESLKKLLEAGYTGFSIDIKGCPETYRRYLGADPYIIYRNARIILDHGGFVEMVYLMVTKANDWDECIEWVIDNHLKYLGEDVPLHINKYYPAFKYHEPPTSMDKLLKAYDKARRAGIKYVYIGNIPNQEYQDTKCPRCGKTLIVRRNYRVIQWRLTRDDKCPYCGYKINIYGEYIK